MVYHICQVKIVVLLKIISLFVCTSIYIGIIVGSRTKFGIYSNFSF